MAKAEAIIASMVNATATNASSMAAPPPNRTTTSRATALVPTSSAIPCTTLPINKPYKHSPTVHTSSAPRSSRSATPNGPLRIGPATGAPGRSANNPAPTSRRANNR
jgi:hypothetical protein